VKKALQGRHALTRDDADQMITTHKRGKHLFSLSFFLKEGNCFQKASEKSPVRAACFNQG